MLASIIFRILNTKFWGGEAVLDPASSNIPIMMCFCLSLVIKFHPTIVCGDMIHMPTRYTRRIINGLIGSIRRYTRMRLGITL